MLASMTSKGQITVPAEARKRLGLHAGSKVDFVINEKDHLELIPVADSVRALKGSVPKPSRPLSLEDMGDAIAEGART